MLVRGGPGTRQPIGAILGTAGLSAPGLAKVWIFLSAGHNDRGIDLGKGAACLGPLGGGRHERADAINLQAVPVRDVALLEAGLLAGGLDLKTGPVVLSACGWADKDDGQANSEGRRDESLF